MPLAPFTTAVGINYSNTYQSNPILDSTAASDIIATGITPVKLFNYKQDKFFKAATGLQLVPGIPNSELSNLYNNNTTDIVNALTPYKSQIAAIMVGNEPLLENASLYGPMLATALTNLNTALTAAGITVPLSVPFNSGIESVSWPPSQGAFQPGYAKWLKDVCAFLQTSNSFFTINIYPYYAHINSPQNVPLDYALFTKTQPQFKDNGLNYYNLFDAMYDATVTALTQIGYGTLPLVVGETGWPTANGLDATVANAQTFNQNLINHINSGNGTPANPTAALQTFLFEMYDEDQKQTPPDFEPNWGVYENSGGSNYSAKYTLNW